jgi:hypothetical protein
VYINIAHQCKQANLIFFLKIVVFFIGVVQQSEDIGKGLCRVGWF